ncbi:hypothetical protein ACFSQE_17845 [Vogesella fluminis]|uniref:hypothetical protein n=1 Tax=Vogesella fluminis TaxID=1069161 RepID=UPI0036280EAF
MGITTGAGKSAFSYSCRQKDIAAWVAGIGQCYYDQKMRLAHKTDSGRPGKPEPKHYLCGRIDNEKGSLHRHPGW